MITSRPEARSSVKSLVRNAPMARTNSLPTIASRTCGSGVTRTPGGSGPNPCRRRARRPPSWSCRRRPLVDDASPTHEHWTQRWAVMPASELEGLRQGRKAGRRPLRPDPVNTGEGKSSRRLFRVHRPAKSAVAGSHPTHRRVRRRRPPDARAVSDYRRLRGTRCPQAGEVAQRSSPARQAAGATPRSTWQGRLGVTAARTARVSRPSTRTELRTVGTGRPVQFRDWRRMLACRL